MIRLYRYFRDVEGMQAPGLAVVVFSGLALFVVFCLVMAALEVIA